MAVHVHRPVFFWRGNPLELLRLEVKRTTGPAGYPLVAGLDGDVGYTAGRSSRQDLAGWIELKLQEEAVKIDANIAMA